MAVLMLVGERGVFADSYVWLFSVFGAGSISAALVLAVLLIRVKSTDQRTYSPLTQ